MNKVLSFNAPLSKLNAVPELLMRLRWRVKTKKGQTIASSWTPEVRYPSITRVLKEFDGAIETVYVDSQCIQTHAIQTLGHCPGDHLKSLSYKGMANASGLNVVVGIELRDVNDNMLLVLRDGMAYIQEPRKAKS